MRKKILLSLAAVVAISLGVVGMSAFEAHIINVTAQIENALFVPIEAEGLSFGTVFPEEVLDQEFDIRLSESFLEQTRLDDVEYILRQKPKCGIPIPDTDPVEYSGFVPVTDGPNDTFVCPPGSVKLPLLCPYLSKHEVLANCIVSNVPGESTCPGIDAFHGSTTNWTMLDTLATQFGGQLTIDGNKTSATYNIDLHAPCFKGMCAQDNVIPPAYEADPQYEHQLFGCDLWFEVTGFSLPNDRTYCGDGTKQSPNDALTGGPLDDGFEACDDGNLTNTDACLNSCTLPTCGDGFIWAGEEECEVSADCDDQNSGTTDTCTSCQCSNTENPGNLTVVKVVENNGVGTKVAADFQMTIDAGNVNQNQAYPVSVGNHTVSEVNNFGYATTFSAECPGGVANVPASTNVTCTVTNEFLAGTLTVVKVVANPGGLSGVHVAGDFQMTIDGNNVAQNTPVSVSAGNHTISETNNFGYTTTFSAECPGGLVNVPADGNVTCTVTNTVPFATLTVNKVVINNDGGNNVVSDFTLLVNGITVLDGISKNFAPGSYTVSETGLIVSGYDAKFLGIQDCDLDGNVTLVAGAPKTCTITNDDFPARIILFKNVINDSGGTAAPGDFSMRINGVLVPSGTSKSVDSNFGNIINEDAKAGYHFDNISGNAKCPAAPGGTATLDEGEVITCTIENHDEPT